MTDKDYAPLSAVCVRTLSDKVYEKRKAAAFEIEKYVITILKSTDTIHINYYLLSLKHLICHINTNIAD